MVEHFLRQYPCDFKLHHIVLFIKFWPGQNISKPQFSRRGSRFGVAQTFHLAAARQHLLPHLQRLSLLAALNVSDVLPIALLSRELRHLHLDAAPLLRGPESTAPESGAVLQFKGARRLGLFRKDAEEHPRLRGHIRQG